MPSLLPCAFVESFARSCDHKGGGDEKQSINVIHGQGGPAHKPVRHVDHAHKHDWQCQHKTEDKVLPCLFECTLLARLRGRFRGRVSYQRCIHFICRESVACICH